MHSAYYLQPGEWAPHAAVWTAHPSRADLWADDLAAAQDEHARLCQALHAGGEHVRVLVADANTEAALRARLGDAPVDTVHQAYGDIWLRDTAPVFVHDPQGRTIAARFRFNGWGNKYLYEADRSVALAVSQRAALPSVDFSWVLEGGSVDSDGAGTCLTSRQCLLNANRNPGVDAATVEVRLREALGAQHVIWTDEGLRNDHTDGHIDTIARFVAPGHVVCMAPADARDPNYRALTAIADALEVAVDARGERLRVSRIASPGTITDAEGNIMPASYLNFFIANRAVIVPTYGGEHDATAVQQLAALFPGRKTTGLPALAILSGGGAFHCITQQQPEPGQVRP